MNYENETVGRNVYPIMTAHKLEFQSRGYYAG
jgi:hypothetical protein